MIKYYWEKKLGDLKGSSDKIFILNLSKVKCLPLQVN